MDDSKAAQDTEADDRAGGSEARQFLSRLSKAFGADGTLIVQKSDPGPEGANLAPCSALQWPRCECGSAKCPDSEALPIDSRPVWAAAVSHGRDQLSRKVQ